MPKAIQPAGDRAASKARPAGSESACSPRARGWLAGVGAGGVLAESPGIGGRREGGEGRGFWRIPHGPLLPYTHRQERTCSGSPAPGPTPPPPPTDKKPPQPHRQTSPQMGTCCHPSPGLLPPAALCPPTPSGDKLSTSDGWVQCAWIPKGSIRLWMGRAGAWRDWRSALCLGLGWGRTGWGPRVTPAAVRT